VRRKTSKPTDRSRNSVSSEFQTIGPATEKARWPNVIRRQRGTVSWCWLTERRCRLFFFVYDVVTLLQYISVLLWPSYNTAVLVRLHLDYVTSLSTNNYRLLFTSIQVCNSLGQCHCEVGFSPPDCSQPGGGGSYHSNSASPHRINTTTIGRYFRRLENLHIMLPSINALH